MSLSPEFACRIAHPSLPAHHPGALPSSFSTSPTRYRDPVTRTCRSLHEKLRACHENRSLRDHAHLIEKQTSQHHAHSLPFKGWRNQRCTALLALRVKQLVHWDFTPRRPQISQTLRQSWTSIGWLPRQKQNSISQISQTKPAGCSSLEQLIRPAMHVLLKCQLQNATKCCTSVSHWEGASKLRSISALVTLAGTLPAHALGDRSGRMHAAIPCCW